MSKLTEAREEIAELKEQIAELEEELERSQPLPDPIMASVHDIWQALASARGDRSDWDGLIQAQRAAHNIYDQHLRPTG